MLYCTYEQYQTAGGTLDEAAFDTLCARLPGSSTGTPLAGQSPTPGPVPGAPPCWPMPASRSSMP